MPTPPHPVPLLLGASCISSRSTVVEIIAPNSVNTSLNIIAIGVISKDS